MKNKEFNKQCEVGKLTEELKSAGFDIYGCSNAGDKTTIHLKDTETKDPTSIVEKHIYIPIDYEKLRATEELIQDEIRKIAISNLKTTGKVDSEGLIVFFRDGISSLDDLD